MTMLLTGAMSKMGVYGLLRIALPLFGPQIAQIRTPLLVLAVVTVVMGAWAAAAQKDLKRVFAYSSVNHLGYCLLGIFALAVPTVRSCDAGEPGGGAEWRDSADVQPRADGGGAVLVCRDAAVAQRRRSRNRRLRRIAQACAGVCRADGDCAVLVAGVAGAEWICRRVSDLPRRVSAVVGGGDGLSAWIAGDSGGDSDGDSEGVYGTGAGALGGVS